MLSIMKVKAARVMSHTGVLARAALALMHVAFKCFSLPTKVYLNCSMKRLMCKECFIEQFKYTLVGNGKKVTFRVHTVLHLILPTQISISTITIMQHYY